MRGEKVTIADQDVDRVIVSVRYHPDSSKLEFARAYTRWGQVWSDIELIDREDLVEALKQGQVIVTGKNLPLAGDFEVFSPVRLGPDDQLTATENARANGDDLGLPIV